MAHNAERVRNMESATSLIRVRGAGMTEAV